MKTITMVANDENQNPDKNVILAACENIIKVVVK